MKKKILLVDDDEGLRDLYKEVLVDEGYEVLTAKNGKEALQKLEREKPDLPALLCISHVSGRAAGRKNKKKSENTKNKRSLFKHESVQPCRFCRRSVAHQIYSFPPV